jgi:hypothetical protein
MMQLLKTAGLTICGILTFAISFAQNIKGMVKDSSGTALPSVTVSLRNTFDNTIVGYSVTGKNGDYILQVPVAVHAGNLSIEVRSLGFKAQSKPVVGFETPVNFVLQSSINQLPDVVIRSRQPFLRTHGDTLGYKVSEFSSTQDRVIGDVIKKMPGITVAPDGKISYNNKPVSGVYIGGDNLLDDKYNIATNTVPQNVVDQVQVIENHQPVKVLQNRVMSDDVVLNLSFKKDAKLQLLGQESIGVGLPGKYDVDLNALLFKNKFKAINYLKGNNTGFDVQQDLISHNYSDYVQQIDNERPATVLSIGSVNEPQLSRERYLFNQSGILNLNDLINLKKSVQLRINAYYLHDRERQNYGQQTTVYLPGDTVRYNETQRNRLNPDVLHTQFTLKINQDKYYINDALQWDYNRSANYSELNTNGTQLNQVLKDKILNFSNELNIIKSLRSNNIVQAYSYVSHSTEPESRVIDPGFNAEIFNNETPYAQLLQSVNIRSWYTNNYFAFKIPSTFITQTFRTGFSVQSQRLNSALNIVEGVHIHATGLDSSVNEVMWMKKKFYAEAGYDLPGKVLKLNLSLPVILQQIDYGNSLYSANRNIRQLSFNPQLRLKYQVGIENYLNLNYYYRNETGSVQDIYQGYILKDYRTLYANNADLTQRKNQQAAIGFNYRKALTLFFFSLNAMYNHISANNISSVLISNNIQKGVVLPFANSSTAWTLNGSVSKYSFVLHTTFSGAVEWHNNRLVQIQNNSLLPFNTITQMLILGTDTKLSDQVNFDYKATLTRTKSRSSADASGDHIIQLQQQASINYNPTANVQFRLTGQDYFTHQQGNADLKVFFADASAKFKITRWKTDLELDALNFLNVKNYSTLYLSANRLTATSYALPGRIILLKVLFNI